MYTDHEHLVPWETMRHPPPLKPLPALPAGSYLMLPDVYSNKILLSHPVPSPSLRLDIMALQDQVASSTSSFPLFDDTSSYSHRDSTSSIIDFAQSLLPLTPSPHQPSTPTNSLDCHRLNNCTGISPTLPVSKRGATPDQLEKLCSGLESMHTMRRDSAIFDVTQPKRFTNRRVVTEHNFHNALPTMSSSILKAPLSSNNTSVSQGSSRPVAQFKEQPQATLLAETSFIDWDEDVPKLAVRVKKSIADLRPGLRNRSASAPLVATNSAVSSAATTQTQVTELSLQSTTHSTKLPNETNQRHPNGSTKSGPSKLIKRRSLRYRRTIFMTSNPQRSSRIVSQESKNSCNILPTKSSSKRKRASVAVSDKSSQHRGRFGTFASWVKKVARCSWVPRWLSWESSSSIFSSSEVSSGRVCVPCFTKTLQVRVILWTKSNHDSTRWRDKPANQQVTKNYTKSYDNRDQWIEAGNSFEVTYYVQLPKQDHQWASKLYGHSNSGVLQAQFHHMIWRLYTFAFSRKVIFRHTKSKIS